MNQEHFTKPLKRSFNWRTFKISWAVDHQEINRRNTEPTGVFLEDYADEVSQALGELRDIDRVMMRIDDEGIDPLLLQEAGVGEIRRYPPKILTYRP